MTVGRAIGVGILTVLFAVMSRTPVIAQHPVEAMEWMMNVLRPSGQPVVPIFEGWYEKSDGTYDLCFGYFNLNTEEVLDIPLGPDNFIEPARFDGNQPTHFMAVPPPPNLYRRYFCVFTVNVPSDFGRERVIWQLRVRGKTYAVPGHLTAHNYALEEISAESRGSEAPLIRFDPNGPEGRGRSGVTAGPFEATVGNPQTLSLSVTSAPGTAEPQRRPPRDGERTRLWWVGWTKHQGPGDVTFSNQEINIYSGEGAVTTTATFNEPGNYVLRVQAIDNPGQGGSFQFQCCWTNGYANVHVAP